ncbi:CDP-alcohol phosphatidyltransferase [Plantactinospora sp. KBS50]|nr:DUF5941 domain-containing protein [Plantactinospora sp. KBS50]ASW53345.1 CDP-alcohol phosphatidyltransferase [Plantactinospora sp. KBS50]
MRAVLLGSAGSAGESPPGSGPSPRDRLVEQLTRAGADTVIVTSDPAEVARLAQEASGPLLLCADDLVAHTAVLRHLATSPVGPTVALVLPEPPAGDRIGVREDRGQVVAAVPPDTGSVTGGPVPGEPVGGGSPGAGAATGTFGGALRVGTPDLPALAAAAHAVAAARTVAAPGGATASGAALGDADGTRGTPVDDLFAALAGDNLIFSHRVRLLVARRVRGSAERRAAEAAVAAVPSEPAELRLAVKERDDLFTTYCVSTWSPHVTRLAARLRLGPTGVTALSVLFAAVAAALFGLGGRPALVTGAVLLYLGFVLDCVDGQLARFTRQFSPWGGWLDTMADRAKEYIVYAGLAVGVERSGLGNGWALAIAAITLQTVRHMTDAWYGVLHDEAARRPGPAAGGGIGARLSQASNRVQADTGSVGYWLKRTVVFPIGERWALIAITVALFNPLVSLVAVLVWGVLAAGYTLALRTLRSRSMRIAVLSTVDTSAHRDDGPLARWLGTRTRLSGPLPAAVLAAFAAAALLGTALARDGTADRRLVLPAALLVLVAALPAGRAHAGPLDWLVPAVLRAAEYLFVIAAGLLGRVPAWLIFALLLALALHHYDLTARLEKRTANPGSWVYGLGWDGRIILLSAAVAANAATVVFAAVAGYLLVLLVSGALTTWSVAARSGRRVAR